MCCLHASLLFRVHFIKFITKKKTKNIIIFAKNMKDMERINNVLVYLRFIASGQNEVQVIKSIIMR